MIDRVLIQRSWWCRLKYRLYRRYRRIRGQQKADLLLRDIAVTFLVDDVCWKFGLRPRRNPAAKHTMCGCLIVARAMAEEEGVVALSEPAVAAIWSKYGHIAFGKFPHPSTYPF